MSSEGNIYTPKNILITGGCGFIGSNVVQYFVKNYPQYYIVNLDKLDYCSSLKNIESLNVYRNYKFVKGNILSSDLISYLLEEEGIDTILHFAAQTHVDNSFGNSFHFTETNVMGTHTLLESAHRYGKVKRFIHVSTDEVYGEIEEDHGVAEEKVLEPTNPYAATKAAAEFIVKSYNRSFGLPTIITRGNNVYGPHQFPEKIIPKFTLRLKRDLPCCLHGDGTNTRNFLYVEDVARAFDTIVHKGEIGHVYNIGTDFELSNIDLAKKLIRLFGKDEQKFIQHVENRKYNDQRYAIDSKKLKQLGWAPQVDFDEGLKKTVDWYLENEKNWDDVDQALAPHPQIRLS